MTSDFLCPHCGQQVQCGDDLAGHEVICPLCQQRMLVPEFSVEVEAPAESTTASAASRQAAAPPEPGPRSRPGLGVVVCAVAFGFLGCTLTGFAWEVRVQAPPNLIVNAVGAALGAAFGWRLSSSRTPSATSCFTLTAASWAVVVLVWGWVLTRPPGGFSDQGGMLITFVVLPLTLLSWLVGGPIALGVARRARKQVQRKNAEALDWRLARAGLFLSRMMLWGGVAFVTIGFLREITR